MPKRSRSNSPGINVYERRLKDGGVTLMARGPLLAKPGKRIGYANLSAMGLRDLEEAYAWAARTSRAIRLSRTGAAVSLPVEEAVESYLGALERESAIGFGVAENTLAGQRLIARELVKTFGHLTPTASLNAIALKQLREALLSRAGTRKTAGTYLSRAGRILRALHEQGLLPLLDRDSIYYATKLGGRVPHERPRCLSVEEIAAVVTAAESLEPMLYALVRWLLLTGQRIREALVTRREWVNLEARVIEIPAHVSKNKRAREIQLRVCPSIAKWLASQTRDHPLVFRGLTYDRARNQLLSRPTYAGKGKRVPRDGPLRQAVPGLIFKDLRSTCASFLHSAKGVPLTLQVAAKQLGHSPNTATRDYIRPVLGIPDCASTLEAAMRLEAVSPEAREQHSKRRPRLRVVAGH